MCDSQTYSQLFLVLFPDYKNISMYLPESLHDLNKSWLLSFVSRAVRATGLWRPLNYSSQTDDWLLIHSFFWKECLIIIPISTPSREKLPSQAVKILHSGFTGSSKLKGSASDTWRMAHQKLRRIKKMNYVRSLWILHLQRMVSHMPVVSSLRQESNWNALRLAQYSRGKLSPLFSYSPLSPGARRCWLWWVF